MESLSIKQIAFHSKFLARMNFICDIFPVKHLGTKDDHVFTGLHAEYLDTVDSSSHCKLCEKF